MSTGDTGPDDPAADPTDEGAADGAVAVVDATSGRRSADRAAEGRSSPASGSTASTPYGGFEWCDPEAVPNPDPTPATDSDPEPDGFEWWTPTGGRAPARSRTDSPARSRDGFEWWTPTRGVDGRERPGGRQGPTSTGDTDTPTGDTVGTAVDAVDLGGGGGTSDARDDGASDTPTLDPRLVTRTRVPSTDDDAVARLAVLSRGHRAFGPDAARER